MQDWNVVISVYQDGFRRALRSLRDLGPIARSAYHNVLVMKVDDPVAALAAIEQRTQGSTALYDALSRVAPSMHCFYFQSSDEFMRNAKSILLKWALDLAGRSFHVRLHRRGGKHELHAQDVERVLDDAILEATQQVGQPGRISFTNPEAIVAIDTIDDRAGLALWKREDLVRHHLLRPD
jgi:tRNA(Ser,Leu) C12 N-acetylase TAN1